MANDNWSTPKPVHSNLDREFRFVADMAASHENALSPRYYKEESNALNFRWSEHFTDLIANGSPYVWCNPPYSNPLPWILKAREAQEDGLGVVMLLNSDNSVRWFAEALKTVSEIRFVVADIDGKFESGRIAFIGDDGKPSNQNTKSQVILVFNPFAIGHRVTKYVKKSDLYKEHK